MSDDLDDVLRTVSPDREVGPRDEDRPPRGTPETALLAALGEDSYHVLHHTGRYFYGTCELAGFTDEEVGIRGVPDEPGYYVLEDGKVGTWKDWETGLCEDVWVDGRIRKARPEDFIQRGVALPIDLSGWEERA